MDGTCTIQDNIHLSKLNIYVSRILGTHQPPFIIKRLPVRFTFDNNYFNDRYQGIPIGGYNVIIENMLKGIEVELNVDFFENREELEKQVRK